MVSRYTQNAPKTPARGPKLLFPQMKTKDFVKNTMSNHGKVLAAEESAGLPLGSLNTPITPLAPPTPFDHQYVDSIARANQPPREPGQPPSRKRRFTRNSEHFAGRMQEIIEVMGLRDPLLVLMEMASGQEVQQVGRDPETGQPIYQLIKIEKLDHKTRAFAASEVLSYVYPKRKSVEVTGAEGQPISFAVTADNSPIAEMPSDEQLERMALERRQAAAEQEKTINAIR